MTEHRLTGLIAAPHTPFHADGRLNLDAVQAQVSWLVEQGVDGAFICGTTGEGPSLSIEERMAIAERWVAVAGTSLKVIVHVGHNNLSDARDLAAHARGIKAAAVGMMPPAFYPIATADQLVDACQPVAKAAGDLPFYYYHIPSMSGVVLPMLEFLREASRRIPTLRGIKYTHNDLMEYRSCLAFENGRFDILFGRDELLLAGLAYGCRGAVGSTYNYAAPLYQRMISAFEQADLASARQMADLSHALVRTVVGMGELAAGKSIMKYRGVDCGPPRPPLRALDDATERRLHAMLGAGDLSIEPKRYDVTP